MIDFIKYGFLESFVNNRVSYWVNTNKELIIAKISHSKKYYVVPYKGDFYANKLFLNPDSMKLFYEYDDNTRIDNIFKGDCEEMKEYIIMYKIERAKKIVNGFKDR